jgi:hypothetical protein
MSMTHQRAHAALLTLGAGAALCGGLAPEATQAHHSFAMYDDHRTHVFTGVVTRVSPDANHLQIFFAPLNEERKAVVRGDDGAPVIWAVELRGASQVAQDGITVDNFPAGTIFSIGLHPLRNGRPAGGRASFGLFKCPANTPPATGKHCDSVEGSTSHGRGVLPEHADPWPVKKE